MEDRSTLEEELDLAGTHTSSSPLSYLEDLKLHVKFHLFTLYKSWLVVNMDQTLLHIFCLEVVILRVEYFDIVVEHRLR